MSQKQRLTFPIPKPPTKAEQAVTFFLTPFGRKVTHGFVTACAAGCLAINFLADTVFVQYYRDFITSYSFGSPKEVPTELTERIQSAAIKLKINNLHRKNIKAFVVTGLNLHEIGSLKSVYGGWIGIPTNYFSKATNDIDTTNIFTRSEPIPWDSKYGEQLQQSLALTENEQEFSFCRAILELKTFKVLINNIIPCFTICALYNLGVTINTKYNLYARPLSTRIGLYAALGIFGFGFSLYTTDLLQCIRDRRIDEKLAALGPDVIKSGISYYDKQLKKNIAIRELSGRNLYTAEGNENNFLRIKSLPITMRKQYFEKKLNECEQKEQKLDNGTSENVLQS